MQGLVWGVLGLIPEQEVPAKATKFLLFVSCKIGAPMTTTSIVTSILSSCSLVVKYSQYFEHNPPAQ